MLEEEWEEWSEVGGRGWSEGGGVGGGGEIFLTSLSSPHHFLSLAQSPLISALIWCSVGIALASTFFYYLH